MPDRAPDVGAKVVDGRRLPATRKEYRIRKFGSWERSLELDANIVAVGETEGIHFALNRIERTPNTVDAHGLIWLADQQSCQNAVVDAQFVAYFTEGQNIADRQTLIEVVAGAGLRRQLAEAMLNSDQGMDEFTEAGDLSRRHRVSGVSFFIINDGMSLSGAQQPDAFLDVFEQAIGGGS
jgi:predicted DsbA family dithiol-disulfide isomerase